METCYKVFRAPLLKSIPIEVLLRRRHFSRAQLKLFHVLVQLVRRVDGAFPWTGLGLVAVARRDAPPEQRA